MSKLSVLASLRRLLARPDTRVVERRMKECGQSTWKYDESVDGSQEITSIVIYLDPRRDGRARVVIHELLHILMSSEFKLDERMVYEMEEVAILAWEKKLYDYLHVPARHKLLESWNQAILRKMR
jgi:hypothetical protein